MEATLELRFQALQTKTEQETRGVSPDQWREIQATLRSRGVGCAVGAMACGGCPLVRQCQPSSESPEPEPMTQIFIPQANVRPVTARSIGAHAWNVLEAMRMSSSNCRHGTPRRDCTKCSPEGSKKPLQLQRRK